MVRELKQALQTEKLLLAADVPATKQYIKNGYEIHDISKHLDFINLIAYVSSFVGVTLDGKFWVLTQTQTKTQRYPTKSSDINYVFSKLGLSWLMGKENGSSFTTL